MTCFLHSLIFLTKKRLLNWKDVKKKQAFHKRTGYLADNRDLDQVGIILSKDKIYFVVCWILVGKSFLLDTLATILQLR